MEERATEGRWQRGWGGTQEPNQCTALKTRGFGTTVILRLCALLSKIAIRTLFPGGSNTSYPCKLLKISFLAKLKAAGNL
jgi:hypothetical protein